MTLAIVPVTLAESKAFVTQHHRHHRAPVGGMFSLAISEHEAIVGVAIVGRPVSRMLADGWTAEVTRVCVLDGIKNGCSMLYGACWRAAKAMGYRKLVTYTLAEEGGGSLRAAGWRNLGEAGGGSWSRKDRPRVDMHPTQKKIRWEAA